MLGNSPRVSMNLRAIEYDMTHSKPTAKDILKLLNTPQPRQSGKTHRLKQAISNYATPTKPIIVFVPDLSHARQYDELTKQNLCIVILWKMDDLSRLYGMTNRAISDDVEDVSSLKLLPNIEYLGGYYTPTGRNHE